jgi:hypothetical protein
MSYLSKSFGLIFIISSFMPWTGIPDLDSQPFPVFFCTIFLLLNYQKLANLLIDHQYLISLFLITSIAWLFCSIYYYQSFFTFLAYRGLYNYFGFIILIIGYLMYFNIFRFPLKILVVINLLWILIGIIQIFYPSIVLDFVAYRTTEDRGWPSLAPEPTFFGIFLFFISWIYLIRFNYQLNLKFKLIFLANILSILFLAKSSMIILYLLIILFIYIIFRCSIKYKFFTVFFLGILVLALSYIEYDAGSSRILYFISMLSSDPVSFFSTDESANQRLSNIVLPIHGLIYNHLIPGGFHSFFNVAEEIIPLYNGFFYYSYGDLKIMSWLGAMIYELGFFGIIIIYMVGHNSCNGTAKRFMEVLILIILLLSAIPISFPLIPFIFSLFMYKKDNTKLRL